MRHRVPDIDYWTEETTQPKLMWWRFPRCPPLQNQDGGRPGATSWSYRLLTDQNRIIRLTVPEINNFIITLHRNKSLIPISSNS